MTTKIANRRTTRRYSVARAETANVEFHFPNPNGQKMVLPMIDISIAGFSFKQQESLPGLELGSSIDAVVVRLGDCEIKGDLIVMHLSETLGPEAICGALFYPESDTELVKLKCVVAGIEAQQGS